MSNTDTGIIAGLTPSGSNLQYGIVENNRKHQEVLSLESFGQKQTFSANIAGKFYVYRQYSHGQDSYLVLYVEYGEGVPAAGQEVNGTFVPGKSICQQALPGGGHNSNSIDLAKGYFLHRVESFVKPEATDPSKADGIS